MKLNYKILNMKLDDLIESINKQIKEEPIYTLGDVYDIIDRDVKR